MTMSAFSLCLPLGGSEVTRGIMDLRDRIHFTMKAYKEAFQSGSSGTLKSNYLKLGTQNAETRARMFTHLIEQRKLLKEGWDDQTIEILLNELSSMDSNNYMKKGGVGEREGRVYSDLVARRHYRMAHGIGRSGDLEEAQPKAAGSSLMSAITNGLLLDFMKTFVTDKTKDACLLPVATGMSINLTLQALKLKKPLANIVIISRCDQMSCLKAVMALGLTARIIDMVYIDRQLETSKVKLQEVLKKDHDKILCVITTTSCFAPRAPDDIKFVSKLIKSVNDENGSSLPIYHIVNNAYGIQSKRCTMAIAFAARSDGRVDIVVQSTDKNLLVPVGGSIIADFGSGLVKTIQANYPGRASSSQTIDVLITLLSLGKDGYYNLLQTRENNFTYLHAEMTKVAAYFGEVLITTPDNDISISLSLENSIKDKANFTKLGSMLFQRNVMGSRVIQKNQIKNISGLELLGWGSHCSNYPIAYLTAAAAIGMSKSDVDYFIGKLMESFKDLAKKDEKVAGQ